MCGSVIEQPPFASISDLQEDEVDALNEANYDEFEGYSGSLFSKDPYDKGE